MDCDKTVNGWFELKAVINNNWEHNVHGTPCHHGSVPYQSNNHWARCGMKNVLHFNGRVMYYLFQSEGMVWRILHFIRTVLGVVPLLGKYPITKTRGFYRLDYMHGDCPIKMV
jgi:hypothetical protein